MLPLIGEAVMPVEVIAASVVVLVADNVVNAPAAAVVPPIAPGAVNVAPFSELAFRLATLVVEATMSGAVPVAIVLWTVVNLPVVGVVLPIAGGEARYVEKPAPLTVLDAASVVNDPPAAAVPPIAGGEAR